MDQPRAAAIGIDAGATLWKPARAGEGLELESLPAGAIEEVRSRLASWIPVRLVSELEAWERGAAWSFFGTSGSNLFELHLGRISFITLGRTVPCLTLGFEDPVGCCSLACA